MGGVRYRWVVLLVAFLVHLTSISLIWQAVSPLKKAMATDLGVPWADVAVVLAAIAFGLVFTQLPGGALGDKYPIRYVVGLGAVLAGVATAIRFAVPTLTGQIAVSIVATVGMGIVNPNLIKVVTEWFPSDQLGLGQGVLMAGNTLGIGVAFALSGGIVLTAVGSWQRVFLLYGGITVAAGVLWLVFVRSPREEERPTNVETGMPLRSGEGVPFRESVSSVLRSPSTPYALALIGLAYWSVLGSLAVLPEWADAQAYTVPEYMLGTSPFASTMGALFLPPLSDRYTRRLGLVLGILGLSFGIIILAFAPLLPVFLIGLLVSGFFGGGLAAMFYILPGELADIDPNHVGTMSGILLSLGQVGSVVGSIVGAQTLARYGLEVSVFVVAVPSLIGLLLFTRLHLDGRGQADPSGGAVPSTD
ncbi:MFS transporter (plasmid) [Haloferax mediterranei ATCC 33500]|uniref:MFS transporter n=2 Tax=Haloferacaceae TaxID=1644056 RepID=I3R909_HALMT|nr:sugar phosphate permease [Haloferax mediterranei ATCC 33500]AHZ24025.1 sugar phosphate permease [Haloferax mediterranei ATCC 33500]ELZ97611.1 sugar phosphate permease [Haloferax mediterranei ATCC 33500]QCQ77487.1 MFS transporter [Haloferax mediterranei ATCC 33500]